MEDQEIKSPAVADVDTGPEATGLTSDAGEVSAVASAPEASPEVAVADTEKADLYNSEPELLAAIAAGPAAKVTTAGMEGRMTRVEYFLLNDTVTICSITLDNGYSVRGESACVNPANFDEKIGKMLAYNNALAKLWPLFGFLLAEQNFLAGK